MNTIDQMVADELIKSILFYGQKTVVDVIKFVPDNEVLACLASIVLQRDAGKLFDKYIYDPSTAPNVLAFKEWKRLKEVNRIMDNYNANRKALGIEP